MAFDYSKVSKGNYVYPPKVGEEATFDIKEIREVKEGNDRFHFKVKEKIVLPDGKEASADKSLGWHIECELADGKILSVTSYAVFMQVFKENNIQDGEKVFMKHIGKGEWEVKKL